MKPKLLQPGMILVNGNRTLLVLRVDRVDIDGCGSIRYLGARVGHMWDSVIVDQWSRAGWEVI